MASSVINQASQTQTPSAELRLGVDVVGRRQELEGQTQSFGEGKKWLPLQVLDPVMRVARGILHMCGLYHGLARKATRITVTENDVYLRGITPSLAGLKVLHLTDLHIDGSKGLGQRLADKIATLDFDLAVITGDLRLEISGDFQPVLNEMAPLVDVLKKCEHGVYAILGNHDEFDMVEPLEAMGVQYLLNESATISVGFDRIQLAGVDDAHFFGTDDIDKALQNVSVNDPTIFLCHSPDLIREASELFCDLYLCGHTHGGQICLPGGKPIVSNASAPRRFCSGFWIHGGMRGYTSRGIGFSGVPFRSHCQAELVVHTIHPERRNPGRIDAEEEAEKALYPDDREFPSKETT